jgi:type IV pilus assembly protein PilO
MKSRTIMVSVLAAVAIIVVWWMFLYSPARSDASKVNDDVNTAKEESRSLETQVKQVHDLERHAPEIKAQVERLRDAVPQQPELASFIDQANQIATDAGVDWASISPTDPSTATNAGEIQLQITVNGGYYEVLDYLNRLDNLPRLVVVDQISVTAAADAGTGTQKLTAALTARMFTQGSAAAAAGATTPTSVAGGGGVAAPQQTTTDS